MTNPMTAAKTWLRNKCIHVPDDWLQACIEWISEENQGISQVQSQINELVYEQWLLSDLHELKSQCLPADITSVSKFQLTGTYALQIDSIVDVSQSYYSQLQKVKGTANDNVNVTAEPPAPWEPKATRMLMLKLTDGSVDVQGMEYQRITNLHNQIHPGTKILVQGSVMCRHGVLMLAGKNVKVLNGEVDTLMEVNTETNVLQKALMQDSGKQYRQDFDGGMVQNKKPGNRVNVKSESSYNNAVKQEPFSQTNRSTTGQRGQTPNYQGRQVGTKVEAVNNDDEWDDDIALDDLLDDMDDFEMGQIPPPPPSLNMETSSVPKKPQNKEKLQSTNKNAQRSIAQYGLNIGSTSSGNSTSSNYTTTVKTEICSSRKDTNKSNTSNLSAFTTSANSYALPKGHNSTNRKTSDSSYANSASNMSELMNRGDRRVTSTSITVEGEKLFEDDDGYELDDFDTASVLSTETGVTKNTGIPPGSEKIINKPVDTQIFTDGVKQNVQSVGTVLATSAKTCLVTEEQTGVSKMSLNNDIPIKTEANIQQMNSTNSSNLNSDTSIKVTVDCEDDCPELTYIPQKSKPLFAPPSRTLDNYSQGSNQCIDQDIQRAGLKRTLSDADFRGDHKRVLTSMPVIGIRSEPFTYLSVVQKHLPTQEIFTCKVKAYISTLTGKLEHNGGKKWSLSCKINDGTATQDVDLSNAVLTKLIGFSAPDSMEMRKRARVDKSIRDTLVKGVQQCQQKLIELLCVMEIQVMPGCTKPEIISLCDFTRFDIQNLEARVSSAISK